MTIIPRLRREHKTFRRRRLKMAKTCDWALDKEVGTDPTIRAGKSLCSNFRLTNMKVFNKRKQERKKILRTRITTKMKIILKNIKRSAKAIKSSRYTNIVELINLLE